VRRQRFVAHACRADGDGHRRLRAPNQVAPVAYFVSDKFGFGLIVCRIGDAGAFSPSEAWLYKVNHVSHSVGADQYRLRPGDEVLWYFADFTKCPQENACDELVLRAPARVRPNEPFTVTVLAYDFAGNASRAAAAKIGGDLQAHAGANGRATLTAPRQGSITLRAKRGNDVPSAPSRCA
jgi:hypothetical protein